MLRDMLRFFCPVCLLIPALGCSDYELQGKASPEPGAEDTAPPIDSGAPPSCEEWTPATPGPPVINDGCMAEVAPGTFNPVVEWRWSESTSHPGYDNVASTVMVANLTDDDGDGAIGHGDIPELVFTSFRRQNQTGPGVLQAISGDGAGLVWSVTSPGGHDVIGYGGVAIGDLEGDGRPDICVGGTSIAVICLEADGSFKWAAGTEIGGNGHPAIADLDADGRSEVIFGRQIFDSTGTLVGLGEHGSGNSRHYTSFPADLDGDGNLEVVTGNAVYRRDGSTVWANPEEPDGYMAAGDFNGDGLPELIRVENSTLTLLDASNGSTIWSSAIPGAGSGGGPPTVADFDADGAPEVGVAGSSRYAVFDTDGTLLWDRETEDDSSRITGSSVFDFEGDGAAEVVYADEHVLYIFDGRTGAVLMEIPEHASNTRLEYPVIADVDGDDSTEIVLASSSGWWQGWNGVTVIGDVDSSWAPARPIWNQYAYHITNIEADGGVPLHQTPNWPTWNSFRAAATELGPGHWRPDLTPGFPDICDLTCSLDEVLVSVPVANSGRVRAEAVEMWLIREDGTPIGVEVVDAVPEGTATQVGPFRVSRAAWGDGELFAVVDQPELVEECDESDNQRSVGTWPCP